MTTADSSGYAPEWLRLREPADTAARAADLVALLPAVPAVIRDLGCGTGAMGRWLSGRLPKPQRWILHDQDQRLLKIAARSLPPGISVVTEQADVTRLGFGGTSLVTASALLDLLTEEEIQRLVKSCVDAQSPALFTLSVTGSARLTAADAADEALNTAFNDHQRRDGKLGPEAVAVTAAEFQRYGWTVHTRLSPWQLGPEHRELIDAWYRGFVAAAREEQPDLTVPEDRQITEVTVHHQDLLALP
ncbi:class I SAM-dependent methyltransferase [Amycolatopsis rubida]|uniref:Class I SAM-dependent methyltransferase n=1 Tax=Amycolatopsis rubida TaxID=112413 RepID=A0ABX0BXZ4_9PSEU|nr:class I SAM-dependent methyltransferase [Amycolatopsis sp. M39]MYW95282.1 methyltransferase domain-containing protein [Amycolatopsis rubida]NEC60271.1 class I SAM-dependent methyltransferase [Amycolatopsis rubida]OAP28319.1 Trans-aconitate 2-methyltransferase [Amycolatopsis sp. M39]